MCVMMHGVYVNIEKEGKYYSVNVVSVIFL